MLQLGRHRNAALYHSWPDPMLSPVSPVGEFLTPPAFLLRSRVHLSALVSHFFFFFFFFFAVIFIFETSCISPRYCRLLPIEKVQNRGHFFSPL